MGKLGNFETTDNEERTGQDQKGDFREVLF